MTADEFQKHAAKMFPIVPHLGLSVKKLSDQESILFGKLSANRNHLGTAFGGSLYCFAALSCYGLVWAAMAREKIANDKLVISEGNIEYLSPVTDDFEVRCVATPQLKKFINSLSSKNKARVALSAQVMSRGNICAQFTGTYVALLK